MIEPSSGCGKVWVAVPFDGGIVIIRLPALYSIFLKPYGPGASGSGPCAWAVPAPSDSATSTPASVRTQPLRTFTSIHVATGRDVICGLKGRTSTGGRTPTVQFSTTGHVCSRGARL